MRPAAAALVCSVLAGCSSDPAPPRNLVLVSFDTVRRDHLPTSGYARDTARAADLLAQTSVVFDEAYAQEVNTAPSHGSMFTGLYPHVHGIRRNGDRLPAGHVTLAQTLRVAGFRTAAFISGVTLQRKACGLDLGFEVYEDDFDGKRRDGAQTTALALDWLRKRRPDERFFLFLHLFDAHGPYEPPAGYEALFESAYRGPDIEVPAYQVVFDSDGTPARGLHGYVDRYDAMIRYADDQLARLLARLDFDDTVVIVLADHGESLGERFHKLDHGAQLFDEEIRIPLILRAPGLAPRRVATPVETTALLPTVLQLLEVQPSSPRPAQGQSLLPLLRGDDAGWRGFVFSAARAGSKRHADRGYQLDRSRRMDAIRSSRFKLIRYPGHTEDYLELYDLEADPGEHDNVAGRFPAIRDEYLKRLEHWLGDDGTDAQDPEIDPEVLDKLRQLGYVGG